MHLPLHRGPLATALLILLGLPAHATAPDVADAGVLDTIEVRGVRTAQASTATRTSTPLRDIPQSVSAVTRNELDARNVRSVNEALETVPGVSATLGEGRRDQVNIRGFSALYDQYLDGFRDDTPYYRDLAGIERIEVLRGPASVLYGRGSGGGLINRISKQPRFGDDFSTFSLSAGSEGDVRATVDLGAPAGD